MLRRKRFFIAMRLLFISAVFLVLSNIMDIFIAIGNYNFDSASYLLVSWIQWSSQLAGFILTIIGLAFVMNINKSFLLGFIFTCIASASTTLTMPISLFNVFYINQTFAIDVPGTILSIFVILSYYRIFDGISWYFDTLGDRNRSRMGLSYAKTFSILIIAGCAISWISAIFAQKFSVGTNQLPYMILDIAKSLVFTSAYIIYLLYLGKSLKEDF